jgi:hypothetical protein
LRVDAGRGTGALERAVAKPSLHRQTTLLGQIFLDFPRHKPSTLQCPRDFIAEGYLRNSNTNFFVRTAT